MKLTIVGCSGSMSGPRSSASSYLLQATGPDEKTGTPRVWSIVFDLGPGAFGDLWKYVDPKTLDAVVFSHGHADHMADIISLYVYNRWFPSGPLPPVEVYGPPEIEKRTCQIDGWAEPGDFDGSLEFVIAEPGRSFQIGPFTLTPFRALHTVETFGYRVTGPSETGKEATFAFTGDTDYCTSIAQMAQGVDVLLSEAAFTGVDTVRGIHLDGARAGKLASQAGVGRLLLTHIQPWTDPQVVEEEARTEWFGQLDLVTPGDEYAF